MLGSVGLAGAFESLEDVSFANASKLSMMYYVGTIQQTIWPQDTHCHTSDCSDPDCTSTAGYASALESPSHHHRCSIIAALDNVLIHLLQKLRICC